MIRTMQTIVVRFDISKIDSYSIGCWKVFWKAIDPKEIVGALLYEGDSAATLAREENVYCIGVQSLNRSVLATIRTALEDNEDFNLVAGSTPFVEGVEATGEPLMKAGKVDYAGNLVSESYFSKTALGEVRQ